MNGRMIYNISVVSGCLEGEVEPVCNGTPFMFEMTLPPAGIKPGLVA